MKRWLPVLLLVLACLPVINALFKPGFFITHDGEFNLIRLMHFYEELSVGQFPVRWTYQLNYGFGSPLFTFFYPLIYYLASAIHVFGPDFGASLKIIVEIATVGSVLSMYYWLRGHFSRFGAFFGALLFLYVPYRLVVMYVTGSFGVLLSLFFVPLIFISIDRLREGKDLFIPILSLSVFGLLTAHNVTALILLPMVLLYWVFVSPTKKVAGGLLLGSGLAAFFLIPALTETGLVFLSRGVVVNFRDHFPTLKQLFYSKWGYFYSVRGDNDGLSFQLGIAQWLVVLISTIFLVSQLIRARIGKKNSKMALLFLTCFLVSIFLMLPISGFIWEKIPLLSQIQFPWRILAASSLTVPFLAAYLAENRLGKIIALLIIGLLFWGNRNYLRTWETVRYTDNSYVARENLFYGSTDIAWETRPIWVERRPSWLTKDTVEKNSDLKVTQQTVAKNGDLNLVLTAARDSVLVVNRFYYPVWEVTSDGLKIQSQPTEDRGLLSLPIQSGEHEIRVSYQKTQTEALADLTSLVSFLILFHLFLTTSLKSRK